VLESQIVKASDGKCYRITWYQSKRSDSLVWGDVKTETEEVPCPDENP